MFRSVVGVLAVIGVAASLVVGVPASAQAIDEDFWERQVARANAYQEFMDWQEKANPRDFEPKDMKVAAPSSVIAATADTDTDVDRAKNTQRYRPNTTAWTDAKARVAAGSGLTANDVAKTGRWAPKLSPRMLLNLTGGSLLAAAASGLIWEVRDGVLYPVLGLEDNAAENVYCRALDNFGVTGYAQNVLGDFVGAECAPWQLAQDFQQLFDGNVTGVLAGDGFPALGLQWYRQAEPGQDGIVGVCTSAQAPPGWWGQVRKSNGTWGNMAYSTTTVCPGGGHLHTGMKVGQSIIGFRWTGPGAQMHYPELKLAYPNAEWLTRVRCEDGSTRHMVSEAFQQEVLGNVAVPESVSLGDCQPVEVELEMQPEGTGTGTSTDRVKVGGATVPQPVRDWQTQFPNCWDGSCSLDLVKKIGGEMTLDCFEAPDQCLNWHEEVAGGSTSYECRYAQQVVDISECNVYSRVFDRTAVQQGTGYADPKTGQRPGTQTNPTTGTQTPPQTNPGAASSGMGSPVQNPQTNRQCWPQGWAAFNPFEWVLQPVKCALEWAFVPRKSVVQNTMNGVRLAAMNSKPGELAATVNTWQAYTAAMNGGGCAGPMVNLELMDIVSYSGTPLSACSEPAASLAHWSKIIIGAGAILLGLFAITRHVGRVFGYGGLGRSEPE